MAVGDLSVEESRKQSLHLDFQEGSGCPKATNITHGSPLSVPPSTDLVSCREERHRF